MVTPFFMTPFAWKEFVPEKYNPGGDYIVELGGYRTTEQMVEEFMLAGTRLQAAREGTYEYPDGNVPEDAVADRTRSPNFDLADASMLTRELDRKYALSVKAKAEFDKAKAKAEEDAKVEALVSSKLAERDKVVEKAPQ